MTAAGSLSDRCKQRPIAKKDLVLGGGDNLEKWRALGTGSSSQPSLFGTTVGLRFALPSMEDHLSICRGRRMALLR